MDPVMEQHRGLVGMGRGQGRENFVDYNVGKEGQGRVCGDVAAGVGSGVGVKFGGMPEGAGCVVISGFAFPNEVE